MQGNYIAIIWYTKLKSMNFVENCNIIPLVYIYLLLNDIDDIPKETTQ